MDRQVHLAYLLIAHDRFGGGPQQSLGRRSAADALAQSGQKCCGNSEILRQRIAHALAVQGTRDRRKNGLVQQSVKAPGLIQRHREITAAFEHGAR
jgi:hypothetical protein